MIIRKAILGIPSGVVFTFEHVFFIDNKPVDASYSLYYYAFLSPCSTGILKTVNTVSQC